MNPESGCFPCHMPKVKVEKYTYFVDHWIRAKSPFAEKKKAQAALLKLGLAFSDGNVPVSQ